MIDDDNKGIANLLNLPVRTPVRKPKVETQEDPLLSLSESLMRLKPLELPKSSEPKDEYGYTKKQNREIENYIARPKILNNNINSQHKKKIGVLDYIEKVKENYNDPGSENNRYVNKSLNSFENRTDKKDVVTFDPTTQLFTDQTRNIAFKDYHKAKRWNDAINSEDKKDTRKNENVKKINPNRRLI